MYTRIELEDKTKKRMGKREESTIRSEQLRHACRYNKFWHLDWEVAALLHPIAVGDDFFVVTVGGHRNTKASGIIAPRKRQINMNI